MPTARALRLCPTATVLPGDLALYAEVSRSVMALFRSITPLVEPLCWTRRSSTSPAPGAGWATRRRSASTSAPGSSTSRGSPARSASPARSSSPSSPRPAPSPTGMLVVRPPEVMDFLHPLPVGALWGVGPKTEEQLLRLGLRTVGDLAHVPAKTLQRALGAALAAHLHELAWGAGPAPGGARASPRSPPGTRRPSAPTSTTRRSSTANCSCWPSGRRAGCASGGWLARTVSIKVRFADFATITRSRTLDVPTDVGQELYDTARALFDALGLDRARIRLVGVRAERLVDAGVGAAAARARRPRARPAGRRARRRPCGPPVRGRRGAAGDAAAPEGRARAVATRDTPCSGHTGKGDHCVFTGGSPHRRLSPRCDGLVSSAVPSAEPPTA